MKSSRTKTLRVILLLLAAFPLANAAEVKIEKYQEGDWEDEIGYRAAVRVDQTLYISGVAASGEMPAAVRETYNGLAKILKAHGLTFKNVVKENIYTTNLDALKANQKLRLSYYGKDLPAATWVQVQRLYMPDHVIEVELIAVFPK